MWKDIVFGVNYTIDGWTHTASTATFTCAQNGIYNIQLNASVRSTTPIFTAVKINLNGTEVPGSVYGNYNNLTTPANYTFQYTSKVTISITSGDVIICQFISTANSTTLNGVLSTFGGGAITTLPSATLNIFRIA